ncbi:hypothetical protein B296_00053838 [Ensete ventricosum]|uniref:Uncharacterized protein n=1 Tax=Ensete ventricosum TaxID=4639 RepID=A0A426Y3Y3_ENSVE|nr:hypothetical protein B296_00053838 [Ensete ventricosum]
MGSGPLGTLLLQALRGSKLLFMVSISLDRATTATGADGSVPPLFVDAGRKSSIHKKHTRPVAKALVDLPPPIPFLSSSSPSPKDRSRKSKARERGVRAFGNAVSLLVTYESSLKRWGGGNFGALLYNRKVNAKRNTIRRIPCLGPKMVPRTALYAWLCVGAQNCSCSAQTCVF